MIGKLIVHGPTRDIAIARMKVALDEFKIGPVRTTIPLHRRLMDNADFANATFDIHYVERLLKADEVEKAAKAEKAAVSAGSKEKVTA
jgi:acetyl-CoA carboxylase biotin carboxylase subunit